MGVFRPRSGSWYIRSKKDPRWNDSGSTTDLYFIAGPPPEVERALKRLKELYGEPPEDLEWGGMKD